jgi:hypothetical protein
MSRRTARTHDGKVVPLDTSTRVPGGWVGYVLNAQGFAVQVFVPGADATEVIEEALRDRATVPRIPPPHVTADVTHRDRLRRSCRHPSASS